MKYVSLLWVALFVFVSSSFCVADEIPKLASEMAAAISESGKKAIAVADFTDLEGNTTKLGRFLAEEFSVALAGSGQGFQVIDRLHLRSLIKEHELSESGVIDTTTAQKLGKIAGVEALITGTLTPFGDTIRLTAKILDTESARIIGAISGNLPKTGTFATLVESEIQEVQQETYKAREKAAESGIQMSPKIEAMQTKEIKGLSFYLQSCVRSEDSVTLAFLVENKEKDRELCIWRETRIFDNFGNEYSIPIRTLGNKRMEGMSMGVTSLLVSNVPTKLIFTFNNFSRKASSIPLLEVIGTKLKFQMRDIPISS